MSDTHASGTMEQIPAPSSDVCRMVWIRHGETAWNAEKRFQGHLDIPLSAAGQDQADRLAQRSTQWLHKADWRFSAIITSDLSRAYDTAKAIANCTGLPLHVEPTLRERNYGVCAGLTATEMQSKHPAHYEVLHYREADTVIPDGESLQQFYNRVIQTTQQLAQTHLGKTIVVVAHGGVLDCIYRRAEMLSLQHHRGWLLLNTSVNTVDISLHHWQVRQWGDITHLNTQARDEVDQRVV